MSNTASLKKEYQDRIVPALTKEFGYKSVMQVPVLKKIVINQGLGMATADKKIIDIAISELSTITGQKAVATVSKKDISNFKLRKKMPIGVMVTLRREQMYEFLERLVRVALPRIRDFKGIESKLDGRGNYTLGIQEQIIFPEINIDNITKILGMNITFVTSAKTDEEGYALLREFICPPLSMKRSFSSFNTGVWGVFMRIGRRGMTGLRGRWNLLNAGACRYMCIMRRMHGIRKYFLRF